MTEKQMPKLSYDERQAFMTVRKAIKRRPELAAALMEGMSKEVAVSVLLQAKRELDQLLVVNRAFIAASSALAKNPELILDGEKP
jgi:hypothetical protein